MTGQTTPAAKMTLPGTVVSRLAKGASRPNLPNKTGGTDEGCRESARPVKDPRLGVQPRGVLIVRNLHSCFWQRRHVLNRGCIRCAHVGGGQYAQRAAVRIAKSLELRTKLLEATELDERAQKIDRICAIEFASEVLQQPVACGIDDRARSVERAARPLRRLCRPGDDCHQAFGMQPQFI